MKRFLTILLVGALLCLPACTGGTTDPRDTGTTAPATEAGTTAAPDAGSDFDSGAAETSRDYTKPY